MSITPVQAAEVYRQADRLYSLEEVELAIDRIAGEVSGRLQEANPLVLCVMNGGLIPTGRLLTRLDFPLQLDYIHATRYRGETSGGLLKWLKYPGEPLVGRKVLIVDDIVDEGLTLAAIVDWCRAQGAEEVLSAVVTRKLHDRSNGFEADFVGLDLVDRYVFGYGMDYKGYLRNAPGIFAVAGM